MSLIPPDLFYGINNICRAVQIMSCAFLNFLHTSLIASFLDINIFVSTL